MVDTWLLTVLRETNSSAPMSWFVRPRAIARTFQWMELTLYIGLSALLAALGSWCIQRRAA